MEEIKQHCEKIIRILRSDYSTQLQYSGIIKKIYDVMLQIISCDNVNELPDIHWNSIARCFADETTDYQSPILFEIDKIKKMCTLLTGCRTGIRSLQVFLYAFSKRKHIF